MKQTSVSGTVSCVSAGSITHSVARNTSTETWKRHVSAAFSCVSANVNPKLRLRKHLFPLAETWRKHAQKVVRFRCIRSNGNARKRHETGNGNTGYPSCFRNGLTCFCHVSVYGFLQFRPVPLVSFGNFASPICENVKILFVFDRNSGVKKKNRVRGPCYWKETLASGSI